MLEIARKDVKVLDKGQCQWQTI